MPVKELIILGCGPTYAECTYHCETWGVNGTYTFAKRLDKLFMTDEESEVESCWYDLIRMTKINTTLVTPTYYERLRPTGLKWEQFPMEGIQKKFKTEFYSNSIAYMIASALYATKTMQGPNDLNPIVIDGYNRIFFYGIDMMTNSSYIQEKGGVEFWMGVALGMGVEVINTEGSATGKTWNGKMYGYYGELVHEKKEKLNIPWEMMRVGKTSGEEWLRGDKGEWFPVKPDLKAQGFNTEHLDKAQK
jgi:hypothetical protein